MKIVAISDTHLAIVKDLPKADLLIHAGDWSSSGTYKETRNFIDWLASIRRKYQKIVVVPGNHDIWVEHNQAQARTEFKDNGIELLIDATTFFSNMIIHGTPWSPIFGNWSFMAPIEKRKLAYDAVPDDTSILVTHSPPQGYLDVLSDRGSEPGKHAGCPALAEAVARVQPEIQVFGHIHEGAGITTLGKTLLVNASHMDEYYKPINAFKVIYLK